MIGLSKTIIENINLSFLFIFVFAIGFYITVWKRSKMESEIDTYIKVNKVQDGIRNPTVKEMTKKLRIPLKAN